MSGTGLRRDLGVSGAAMLGLGSIVGTGVFVSIGVAAGITGPSVVLAVGLAAIVATLNGLNSAQLAAAHPVSGGTYEYGYRWLGSRLGFTAGWMFLLAKSASAATAALGFAGYLSVLLGWDVPLVPLALGVVGLLTAVVLVGIRRSSAVNTVIVTVTLAGLALFVLAAIPEMSSASFSPFLGDERTAGLLEATALMFVAYTGYGRVATLGEEVRDPRRTIPIAIVITLVVSMLVYVAVAAAAVGAAGAAGLAGATEADAAPLQVVARGLDAGWAAPLVGVAAVTAMAGVLLNLLLGLSRVLLAMGRRGDMPAVAARITGRTGTPWVAVLAVAGVIGGLASIGDVETTWTFSAFTVLVYYALTNLAALRIGDGDRRFPKWVGWAGLVACLGLAFWVDATVWLVGLGLVAFGLVWHEVARRVGGPRPVD